MTPLDVIHSSWQGKVRSLIAQDPLLQLLQQETLPNINYEPAKMDVFKVFEMPLNKVKVVILGQDPYYTPDTATGLAFLSKNPQYIPPSLKVIEEMFGDTLHPDSWPEQGVFLLNTALTVERHKANSHARQWKAFTEGTIRYLSAQNQRVIWLLWGASAKSFVKNIKNYILIDRYDDYSVIPAPLDGNYVLTAAHPVSEIYAKSNNKESTGFLTCNHFVKTNRSLETLSMQPIFW